MGDKNPIRTLGDYSRPSHEGYRNTIELLEGKNVGKNAHATAKLRNDILMFQQHHGESLSEAWTCFKDLLQKFPHHGIDLWLQVRCLVPRSSNTNFVCSKEDNRDVIFIEIIRDDDETQNEGERTTTEEQW
ncbi:hypothetical protein Tco_0745785 [Tanacetum coccineum]